MIAQKCPVCGGSGKCHRTFYEPWQQAKWGSTQPTADDWMTCKACDGRGIFFDGKASGVEADMRQKPEVPR